MTPARRLIIAAAIDHAIAAGCAPCDECEGNPNCSSCGGSGFLDGPDEVGTHDERKHQRKEAA